LQPFQPSIADLQRRGIPFAVREHRIATNLDARMDRHAEIVAKSKSDPVGIAKRNAEWKRMFAMGMKPSAIADLFGVARTTVRRVTGGTYTHKRRTRQRIRVDGVVYDSQADAIRNLHISREKLMRWISTGRAKYVK